MKRMLVLKKLENCIEAYIVSKDKSPSERKTCLILPTKFRQAFADTTDRIIDKDINNFIEINTNSLLNTLTLNFYWLDMCMGGTEIKGEYERITVPFDKVKTWIEFISENFPEWKKLRVLEKEQKTPQLKFHDLLFPQKDGLKNIVQNKTIKHKLNKILRKHFNHFGAKRIEIYYEGNYDFGFEIVNCSNKIEMIGGIIFHRDSEEPNNLKKGYYSVHT